MALRRLLLGCLMVSWSYTASAAAPEPVVSAIDKTPLQFVQNYVRQLATFEELREKSSKEVDADSSQASLSCIHYGTQYDLEARSAIYTLRSTRLSGVIDQLQGVPEKFADLYSDRQQVMAYLTSVCSAFAEGQKPGVDYGKLAATMPKLRAQLEYLDKTAYEASLLVFATLLSDVPDSQGHMSHLVISCDERKNLINQIDISFGSKFSSKDENYDVSQAQLLRDKLIEFKCAEEPR